MKDQDRDAMLEKRREQQRQVLIERDYQERHRKLQECLKRWGSTYAKGKE